MLLGHTGAAKNELYSTLCVSFAVLAAWQGIILREKQSYTMFARMGTDKNKNLGNILLFI